MALCKYEGQIVLSSTTLVGTFAGAAVSVAAGTYYWTTASTGFLATFKAALDAATGRTWTLSIDDGSDTSLGKLTISCTGAATTATWSSTELRNLMGFTINLASGTSWTGTQQVKNLWLPNCGRSSILSPEASTGAIECDYSQSLGADGTPYTLSYSTRSFDSMEHRTVLGSKTWTSKETTTNESFETFYRSVIAYGLKFRFHADRSVDGTYRTWVASGDTGGRFNPTPVIEQWADGAASLWAFRYTIRETT